MQEGGVGSLHNNLERLRADLAQVIAVNNDKGGEYGFNDNNNDDKLKTVVAKASTSDIREELEGMQETLKG